MNALVAGLPRSGTSWMLNVLRAHPEVHVVYEPDNRELGELAWLGTAIEGTVPSLAAGDSAPDYEAMWRLAFAGGWPTHGPAAATTRMLRRAATAGLPKAVRARCLRSAVSFASRREPPPGVVVVKSVAVQFALEWIVEAFHPRVIVVWRHPLNLVPSWAERGWERTAFVRGRPAVRRRFQDTALWPPPDDGHAGIAWSVCAQLTVLLESAARVPDALVLNHEASALDPQSAARDALAILGLEWVDEAGAAIEAQDRPGEGWRTHRLTAEESARWRTRLEPGVARQVLAVIDAFQEESPVAAASWPRSPAITR